MYTILFRAWSPNGPHQSVSRGLLTSSVYLMTHSSDISSPLCHVFQQMYSFPAASWIRAWPEFLHPVPSALIYRAFSQSQRRPRAARAGLALSTSSPGGQGCGSTWARGWEGGSSTVSPLWQNCIFPRDLKGLLQSRKLPGICCFLLLWLIQVQSAAGIYFVSLILHYSWIISFKAQCNPLRLLEIFSPLLQMRQWGAERWGSTQGWPTSPLLLLIYSLNNHITFK